MKCCEEYNKIDEFLKILDNSGIGIIIKKVQNEVGRKGYNPFNLVATIIYCFQNLKAVYEK